MEEGEGTGEGVGDEVLFSHVKFLDKMPLFPQGNKGEEKEGGKARGRKGGPQKVDNEKDGRTLPLPERRGGGGGGGGGRKGGRREEEFVDQDGVKCGGGVGGGEEERGKETALEGAMGSSSCSCCSCCSSWRGSGGGGGGREEEEEKAPKDGEEDRFKGGEGERLNKKG